MTISFSNNILYHGVSHGVVNILSYALDFNGRDAFRISKKAFGKRKCQISVQYFSLSELSAVLWVRK